MLLLRLVLSSVEVPPPAVPSAADLEAFDDVPLTDHEGRPLAEQEAMGAFSERCQRALKETMWREQSGVVWPHLYADTLEGVRLGNRNQTDDPRILYFIGMTRKTAAIMVSRLLLALYHSSHLFLLHVDLKTDEAVVNELRKLTKDHPNIFLMRTRRLVQWGAWTMNLVMLDALHTAVSAGIDFDFVINLSDADIALRTNDEIVTFLREHRGRQFVQVHTSTGEWLEKAKSFSARHRVVECGGYGFVAINSSGVLDLGGGPQQAFGRGGPVLYANTSKVALEEATVAVREDAACSAHERRRLRLVKDGEGGKDGDGAEGGEGRVSGAGVGDAVAAEDATPNATEAALLATNCTALHTGSQWVILNRAFATYLVRDVRAARWMRVFERRFLSDEAFIQTVLMHSPHRAGLVNHNMRYIYWPHFDGDPQVCHESDDGVESHG